MFHSQAKTLSQIQSLGKLPQIRFKNGEMGSVFSKQETVSEPFWESKFPKWADWLAKSWLFGFCWALHWLAGHRYVGALELWSLCGQHMEREGKVQGTKLYPSRTCDQGPTSFILLAFPSIRLWTHQWINEVRALKTQSHPKGPHLWTLLRELWEAHGRHKLTPWRISVEYVRSLI